MPLVSVPGAGVQSGQSQEGPPSPSKLPFSLCIEEIRAGEIFFPLVFAYAGVGSPAGSCPPGTGSGTGSGAFPVSRTLEKCFSEGRTRRGRSQPGTKERHGAGGNNAGEKGGKK